MLERESKMISVTEEASDDESIETDEDLSEQTETKE